MASGSSTARQTKGFTLVELLVVIGIIAVLISILLPALNVVRQQALRVQCQSNLRSLGQAIYQYSTGNNGCVLPVSISQGGRTTYWVGVLVATKYLPDPNIPASEFNSMSASAKSVAVCPTVRQTLIWQNGTVAPGATATSQWVSNGFERDNSALFRDVSAQYPLGLITETGYGINGLNNLASIGAAEPWFDIVSNAVTFDAPPAPQYKLKKMTRFRNSTRTVMLYDGVGYNQMNGDSNPPGMLRISGASHGKFDVAKPYDTGTTNVLFLDGHVEAVARKRLPSGDKNSFPGAAFPGGAAKAAFQFIGNKSQMRDPEIIWGINHQ